jgi:hypothetical protein
MPRLYFAGGGWLTVAVVGVAGLLLSILLVKYRKNQHKLDYEDHPSDANGMNNVELEDDESIEETQRINNTSISESLPILQYE